MNVTIREGESQEGLLARFQKMIQRSGIMQEIRARRHFISKAEKDRISARKAARRRNRRRGPR